MATYTSQYPTQDANHVKTSNAAYGHLPYWGTDPALPITGDWTGNSWGAGRGNQRLNIDLGSTNIIRRIYFENGNYGFVGIGMRYITFQGSNSATAFADTDPTHNTDWTDLTLDISEIADHSSTNQSEPQYAVVTNTTVYQYYSLKTGVGWNEDGYDWKVLRRIELQTEDGYAPGGAGQFLSTNSKFW